MKKYDMKKLDSGSVIPGINSDTIYHLPCMIPDDKWLEQFNQIAYPVYEKIAEVKKKTDWFLIMKLVMRLLVII